jgi:GNAT superfamily N-acetyltransferase
MTGQKPSVVLATDADVPKICELLARVFFDDPVSSFLIPNEKLRLRGIELFMRAALEKDLMAFGRVYVTDDLSGAALWAPAGKPFLSGARALRNIVPVTRYVATNMHRVLRALMKVESLHPKVPHYYLATLGTAPERQGHGIGGALMQPVLARCDANGVPAYLESSKARNLPLYERHGFKVTNEVVLAGGPTIWTMWREPQVPEL